MRAVCSTLLVLALAAWTGTTGRAPSDIPARRAAEDLLAKSMATYATLTSYADSGTAMVEYGSVRDVGHFRTYRRKQPSDFYFEWGRQVKLYKTPGDSLPMPGKRMVFWMQNGELQTYDKETATHRTYPAGTSNQPSVLSASKHATTETITLIPSLLFSKAKLVGPLQEVSEISLAGIEEVGGHRCHKLVGIASSVYPSGAVTNVRPIAVWIDAQTMLIRKVFTDTPKGYGTNSISRFTWVLDPTPNPTLDDSKFQFTVPETQP